MEVVNSSLLGWRVAPSIVRPGRNSPLSGLHYPLVFVLDLVEVAPGPSAEFRTIPDEAVVDYSGPADRERDDEVHREPQG